MRSSLSGRWLWPCVLMTVAACGGCFEDRGKSAAGGPNQQPEAKTIDLQWGSEAGGLRASLQFKAGSGPFRANEAIVVGFALQNVSDEDRIMLHCGFWPNHRIDVTDADGLPAPTTPAGERLRGVFSPNEAPSEKVAPFVLKPAAIDAAWEPVDISKLVQLRPGKYEVSYVYANGEHGLVRSNTLAFEVAAGD